jgi:hypothetical protein
MNVPTKRFTVSVIVTDSGTLLGYQNQEPVTKKYVKQELLLRAQSILLQYPGYVITDPYFEADRDIQNRWTTVTFSFRLEN